MKELLTALINSNNESGKHIKYLYEKYCKLIYEVDYGNKIYESEELFTDFIKYIFSDNVVITEYEEDVLFEKVESTTERRPWAVIKEVYVSKYNSNNTTMTSIRNLLTTMGLEQDKYSNLNTLKNAKIH